MDFQDAIRQLEMEKDLIELALAELRQLQNGNGDGGGVIGNHRGHKSKRGRKSMGYEERLRVSERMKRYWANRREANDQDSTSMTAA
jgi:hypothetical protein